MHEMALTEGVFKILEDQAAAQGFERVKTIWLEIGTLSHVDSAAMAFCFDAIKGNYPIAAAAKLEIISVAGQAVCLGCTETVPVENRFDTCPQCGGFGLKIIAGEEMRLKELEVE